VLADGDVEPRAAPATGLRGDLQQDVPDTDGVLSGDDSLDFDAQDRVQIRRAEWDPRRRRVAGRHGNARVVLRHVMRGQIRVGGLARGDVIRV
jgi:hypothetical protein